MNFISYAQNLEDVILYRALKHVETGFYIDVGAMDPVQDSVTKAFYDRGWRGINLEPVSQWFERLECERPGDINLKVAAGSERGESVLYEIPDTGLSTIDRAVAERHEKELGCRKIERKVLVTSLTDVCRDYRTSTVHFLKIDVECAERQVLMGVDFSSVRPWIILVEATSPRMPLQSHAEWQSILLDADYDHVYFDGVNRFYLSNEHRDLKSAFAFPPNCFDEFVLSEKHPYCKHINAQLDRKTQELDALYSSRTWRLTRPLRRLVDFLVRVVHDLKSRMCGSGNDAREGQVSSCGRR